MVKALPDLADLQKVPGSIPGPGDFKSTFKLPFNHTPMESHLSYAISKCHYTFTSRTSQVSELDAAIYTHCNDIFLYGFIAVGKYYLISTDSYYWPIFGKHCAVESFATGKNHVAMEYFTVLTMVNFDVAFVFV